MMAKIATIIKMGAAELPAAACAANTVVEIIF